MTEQEFQCLSALMNGRTDELSIQEIQRLENRGWITTYIDESFNEFTQSGLRAFELEENARNQHLQQAYA